MTEHGSYTDPRTASADRGAEVLLMLRNPVERLGMRSLVRSTGRSVADVADSGVAALNPPDGPRDAGRTIVIVALRDVGPRMLSVVGRAAASGMRVLVLVEDLTDLKRLVGVSCSGFVLSESLDTAALGTAIDQVLAGDMPMPPEMAQHLLAAVTEPVTDAPPNPVRLTPREQETLVLLVDGLSNKQIARRLGVSNHGAKRLVANVIAKLDCTNRTAAVARALREGVYERCTATAAG